MTYNRCGKSGIKLPAISLGLWHNFGNRDNQENCREILRFAFDNGINHFDLANNYGPPYGSAEENFGRLFKQDFRPYRDELLISTKAGWDMWPGPYGDWGSKKYLVASLNQSLQRMGLEYVDIFYHHRRDPETPMEETMQALDLIVRQGKALYVGISSYDANDLKRASQMLRELGTPCLIHQPRYNILDRKIEPNTFKVLEEEGIGCITYSPLAQGLLTDKYLHGIPEGSRASKTQTYLQASQITPEKVEKIRQLNDLAQKRGQSLAQMALAWIFHQPTVTSVLVGASKAEQLADNLQALRNTQFSTEELTLINDITA